MSRATADVADDLPVIRVTAEPLEPALRLVTADSGNEVRYRVREQLMGVSFPNDAVGHNPAVTGQLSLEDNGAVMADQSLFTVQAGSFTSDKDRRDGYVRRRLLDADSFPTITFQLASLDGLQGALPGSGDRDLTATGLLTIKGVSHPVTWQMHATFTPGQVSGTATTGFTFEDFALTRPRVRVVLSVADSIHLEYDFRMRVARESGAGS